MERTYKFTQREIARHVDKNSARKAFELSLNDFGPYCVDWTRHGKHVHRAPHLATPPHPHAPTPLGTSSSAGARATWRWSCTSRAG